MIVDGARTPIGLKCGTLAGFSPEDLATLSCEEAIRRSGVPRESIDTAVGANVYQCTAPGSQDIYFPRNVALRCRLNVETPALMVQRICGSGLQTIISAMQQIAAPACMDDAKTALCFAGEAMSRTPQIIRAPRRATNFWEFEEGGSVEDSLLAGLDHTLADTTMMRTADEYGARMGVTRAACDEFAAQSHERARHAYRESHVNGGDALKGLFALDANDLRGQPVYLARDECVRHTSVEALAKLPGITPNKLVSAGNASELGDAGAAVVVADADEIDRRGWSARCEVVGYGVAGVDPRVMGRGPVPAITQAVARAGLTLEDVDLFEINEAFAAQYLGVEKELALPREKVNVNGGAIAIAHPLAVTGVRMIVDLMYEMERRGVRHGCASACIGGGQGAAVVLRNLRAG
jgi:acetyl-CoA C-acetyltransferase